MRAGNRIRIWSKRHAAVSALVACATCVPSAGRAATFVVTNTNDTGGGSLRQAILNANAAPGQDAIQFAISLATGAVATISPGTPLPDITGQVTIDGYSQDGSSMNTLATGFNAVLRIRVSGAAAGANASGLTIGATGSIIRGLIVDGFSGFAIRVTALSSTSTVVITGNVLGKGYGTLPLNGNRGGVHVDGSPTVRVGGLLVDERNVIAGNQQEGILVQGAGAGATIRFNRIGLNAGGTAEGNRFGVRLVSGATSIGGSLGNAGNTIASNADADVQVEGGSFAIDGNRIGTDDTGAVNRNSTLGILVMGAASGHIGASSPAFRNVVIASVRAIELRQSNGVSVAGNYICRSATGTPIGTCGTGIRVLEGGTHTIGGATAASANVIANATVGIALASTTSNTVDANVVEDNPGAGVLVSASSANRIGVSVGNTIRRNGAGSVPPRGGVVVLSGTANAILRNAISDNAPLGIDLGADGVTANDALDADAGANNLQNAPVLTSALTGPTTMVVTGSLASLASRAFRVQLFRSAAVNASGTAEGQVYLGEVTITTNASGSASILATLPAVPVGAIVTATATRLDGTSATDTSEFSAGRAATIAPPSPTETPLVTAMNRLRAASLERLEVEFEQGLPIHVAGRVPAGTPGQTGWTRAVNFLSEYRDFFQVASDVAAGFRLDRQRVDGQSVTHLYLQQMRDGIPILGAGVGLHFRGNDFTTSSGRWISSLSPWYRTSANTFPSIPFQMAFEQAVAGVGGGAPDPGALLGKPGLIFYWPAIEHDGTWRAPTPAPTGPAVADLPRLAWRLAILAPGGPWDVVVDAHDGSVLEATTRLKDAIDYEIFTARGQSSVTCFSLFWDDPTVLWYTEDGLENRANPDADADRANSFIRTTYNYWRDAHDRESYDGDDSQIEVYVNFGREANAFGNESCLMFADQMVRLDVFAHEFTHAVTDTEANLAYRREMGALNEHMSDVFGAMVDDNDWLVGDNLPGGGNACLGAPAGTLRDMSNPPNCTAPDGSPFPDHVDPAIDTGGVGERFLAAGQSPNNNNDNGFVHTNSSIPNKVAYLVADGGTHHGVTVAGLGRAVMARIWYKALTDHDLLNERSRFTELRWATRTAARDIYGDASNEKCQVLNAFGSVGIGQPDSDCDGLDDFEEQDDDNDFVTDADDNCPIVANPDQGNADGDDLGDACDTDADDDGLLNEADNCPLVINPGQNDVDGDGIGDACDDSDGDGRMDSNDNCRTVPNWIQSDADGDTLGDACDTDDDNDGVIDAGDNCPLVANAGQQDLDGDSVGNACDNCLLIANANQANTDGDAAGDVCDLDDDNDERPDLGDVCPLVFDPQQIDTDDNGRGLRCDAGEAAALSGDLGWRAIDLQFLTDSPVDIPLFPCVDDGCPAPGEPFAPGQRYTLRLGGTVNLDARIVDATGRVVARGVRGAAGQTLTFEIAPAFRAISARAVRRLATAAGSLDDPYAAGPDEPAYFLQLRPVATSVLGQTLHIAAAGGLLSGADGDGDGITDNVDSCIAMPNADQADVDGDGLGDACDNCPTVANGPALAPGGASVQANADADGAGDACDVPRYLAEGATGLFFDTRLALANPTDAAQNVNLLFQKSDGTTVLRHVTLAPTTRVTLDLNTLPELAADEFSTTIDSAGPVLADRTMTWDASGYGSHSETAPLSPATTWYLAEGATHSGFELFYLIQNPSRTAAADVEVTYLLPAGAPPLVRTYAVPPHSRFNIWVDTIPDLSNTDVSAVIRVTNAVPIIVERAMYLTGSGRVFDAGHASAGVTAPATAWFLAEGATGPFFDLFVLVANPGPTPAVVRATYLLPSGQTIAKTYEITAQSRFNIWVDLEDPRLADTAVSTTFESLNDVPIIVERAMWWGTGGRWYKAHNSPGATATGTAWGMADGEVNDATGTDTFILVANTSPSAGAVRVRLLFEDGTTATRTFSVAAHSRFNVDTGVEFPEAAGRRFGAVVESLGTPAARLVVERALYSSPGGVFWAAGSNALMTRLR